MVEAPQCQLVLHQGLRAVPVVHLGQESAPRADVGFDHARVPELLQGFQGLLSAEGHSKPWLRNPFPLQGGGGQGLVHANGGGVGGVHCQNPCPLEEIEPIEGLPGAQAAVQKKIQGGKLPTWPVDHLPLADHLRFDPGKPGQLIEQKPLVPTYHLVKKTDSHRAPSSLFSASKEATINPSSSLSTVLPSLPTSLTLRRISLRRSSPTSSSPRFLKA